MDIKSETKADYKERIGSTTSVDGGNSLAKEQHDWQTISARHSRSELRNGFEKLESISTSAAITRLFPKLVLYLGCFVTTLPMIGFSIIMLALVFANRKGKATCPYPDLCPSLNATKSEFYYVDVPSTRLIFIASWSSSISLALISVLMMMFSYRVAQQINRTSQFSRLPTPYQATILLKALNGEMWSLIDFLLYKYKAINIFRRRSPHPRPEIPPVLLRTIGVLVISLFSSLLVQIADTWLHISTATASLMEIETQDNSVHAYSRLLQPIGFHDSQEIFDDDSKWPMCNKYLWGYSIDCSRDTFNFRNRSLTFAIRAGTSSHSSILNFTDDQGINYAILGPSGVDNSIDWTATSFGVSTGQCQAVPQSGCNSTFSSADDRQIFNCTKETGGINLAGSFDTEILHLHYLDFHTSITDAQPFSTLYSGASNVWFTYKENPVPIPTHEDTVFLNPWRWVTVFSLLLENPFRLSQNPYIWEMTTDDQTEESFIMVTCETTIWNITYDFVDGQVRNISTRRSNSLTTGTANMPSVGFFDHSYTYLDSYFSINAVQTSIDDMIDTIASSFSKDFASVLGAQTVSAPAVKAQSRNTLLVSQVSKSALWTLILANLLYALIGIILTVLALIAFSKDVHQLQIRFSVAGIMAALFEKPLTNGQVRGESDLFHENVGREALTSRISTRSTDEGGAELVAVERKEVDGSGYKGIRGPVLCVSREIV